MKPSSGISLSIEGRNDGPFNMAEDLALLERAERGFGGARIYQWDGVWVSLGRFQDAEKTLVDPGKTRYVRRPTGGAAVLHGTDLTVSLAVPIEWFEYDHRRLKSIYRQLVTPFVDAFQASGTSAQLGEDRVEIQDSNRETPFCFGFRSANDVVESTTGNKVLGCALRITRKAVLVQASIPLMSAEARESGEWIQDASPLNPALEDPIGWTNALTAAWRTLFGSLTIEFIGGISALERIRLGLWNLWDPIGVNVFPIPHDEYDRYAPLLLNDSHPVQTLGKIRTEFMGLHPNEDADRAFASFLQDSLSASC